MSFLAALQSRALEGYSALQGAQGQPQSASATLQRLVDRLKSATLQEDRRAAVLGIKGMARDWKPDVGRLALPALLGILTKQELMDDMDMAKAILETLHILCEVEETESGKVSKGDTGVGNVDVFLQSPDPTHALIFLLSLPHFYIRFFSLQLLGTLLSSPSPRPQTLQTHLLSAPGGLGIVLSVLDDGREIIRNEALLLLISITATNADIQKIVAFEGAFERLFRIVDVEGGIGGGGIVVQDCLSCVASLLRYNVSNQNYFRETSCVPHLAPMLLFPVHDQQLATLDVFAFQPWTAQKATNAALVISLARTLVSGAGAGKAANQKAILVGGLTRCLCELALASAAPWSLKSVALHALASIVKSSKDNQDMLGSLILSPVAVTLAPVVPAPETTDEANATSLAGNTEEARPSSSSDRDRTGAEAYRLPSQPAILALISLAVSGPPGLEQSDALMRSQRDVIRLRAASVCLMEAFLIGNPDAQLAIVATAAIPPTTFNNDTLHSVGSLLVSTLKALPVGVPGVGFDSYATFFACLVFAQLLRGSEPAKAIARELGREPGKEDARDDNEDDDDDGGSSLVHTLIGNLLMVQRNQSQGNNAGDGQARAREWTRVTVGYLIVLCVWLWESPGTVKEFLSEGTNLQVLIEPVTQASGVDPLTQGLCTFLLGVCYEYDREPDCAISRVALQPILHSRIGADQFANRILRLREDERFKNVGPDTMEMNEPPSDDDDKDDSLWFDWAFVEFFKNNYVTIQRAILVDPGASSDSRPAGDSGETSEMISSLRAQVAAQAKDLEVLRRRLTDLDSEHEEERTAFVKETSSLSEQIASLTGQLGALKVEAEGSSTAQEDLLVLLEDVSSKRRKDKVRMRDKGMEVSDDEEEEDDE